jgi:hypothetical protein
MHFRELLESLQQNTKKDGMGGLGQYLIQLLCRAKPGTIRAAMQRLDMAHKNKVQVSTPLSFDQLLLKQFIQIRELIVSFYELG